jgi:hypothetical protein
VSGFRLNNSGIEEFRDLGIQKIKDQTRNTKFKKTSPEPRNAYLATRYVETGHRTPET